jgi:UDP-GlcNAc:undecaprenyl-phosphate/decaprenyl-phosphate GlcNAc-1-phosphate transferase
MILLVVFLVAFLTTVVLTPRVIAWARQRNVLDVPLGEAKEIHKVPTPRLGGVAIFPAFVLAVVVSWLLPLERQDASEAVRTVALLAGASVVFLLGVWDDLRDLSPAPQFVLLTAASAIPVVAGVRLAEMPNPLTGEQLALPTIVAFLFTLFWIVGTATTVNWIDGLDGLAAGVVAIAAGILAVRTYFLGQESVAVLPLALTGCLLGFLVFNRHPARIFLGGGAYLIGYLLGTMSLFGGPKSATLLLVLALPIIDVAWRIISRIRSRRLPVYGDRGHLHHRLFDLGMSQPRVVVLYYAVAAFFGLLAVALPTAQAKFIALLLTVIVVVIILDRLSTRQT